MDHYTPLTKLLIDSKPFLLPFNLRSILTFYKFPKYPVRVFIDTGKQDLIVKAAVYGSSISILSPGSGNLRGYYWPLKHALLHYCKVIRCIAVFVRPLGDKNHLINWFFRYLSNISHHRFRDLAYLRLLQKWPNDLNRYHANAILISDELKLHVLPAWS